MMINFFEKNQKIFLFFLMLSSFLFILSFYLTPITTNDFWIQLKVGELIRETGKIPNTVLFTFSKAKDYVFIAHEWLPSFVFSFFYSFFGYNFMILLKFTIFVFIYYLAFSLVHTKVKNIYISLFIASLCLFTMNYRSFLRPEIFSYVFFLLHLKLLDLYDNTNEKKFLFFYLLVSVLWANSHGSFLIGIGLPLMYACAIFIDYIFSLFSKKKSLDINKIIFLMLTFLLTILCSLLNPFGSDLIEHVFKLSQNKQIRSMVFEWNPTFSPSVMRTRIFDFYIIFISILGCIFLFRFRSLKAFHWMLLLVFSYMSLEAQRHISFFAIACLLPLSQMLHKIANKKKLNAFFCVSLTSLLLSLAIWSYHYGNAVSTKAGIYKLGRLNDSALKFIEENNISGNVINSYSFGAQILFNFFPKIKVSIDSRIDAYGFDYMQEYRDILYGEYSELKKYINRFDIKHMIVNYNFLNTIISSGHLNLLNMDGWKLVYEENGVVILSKT